MANIVDFISEEDYPRYNELLDKAAKAKAEAPKKPRAPRGPMTNDQKKKALESRLAKAQAALDKLLAGDTDETAAE